MFSKRSIEALAKLETPRASTWYQLEDRSMRNDRPIIAAISLDNLSQRENMLKIDCAEEPGVFGARLDSSEELGF
jgi:hypothetical protein